MTELLTLARPYAKAVFNLAKENNNFDFWSDLLEVFANIGLSSGVKALQENPNVSTEELVSLYVNLYSDVSGKKPTEQESNFLRLLSENNRLNLLPDLFVLYEQHKAEELRHIEVEMVSAFAVTKEQKLLFISRLKEKLGKEINLQCRVDPMLVGGAIIRAGDKVIDGSVRGKLYQMAESLGA